MSPIKGTVNRMRNMLGINSYQGYGDSEAVRFVGSAGTNSYHEPSLHHKMKKASVSMMHKAKKHATSMMHKKHKPMYHHYDKKHKPMYHHYGSEYHHYGNEMMHKAKKHATSMMKMPFNMVSFIAGPGIRGASEAATKAAKAVKSVAPNVGGTRAVMTSPKAPGKKRNRMMMGGMGLIPKPRSKVGMMHKKHRPASYQGFGDSEEVTFVGVGGIES